MAFGKQRPAAPWSQGNWWGQYDTTSDLPNAAGASLQTESLQAGDVAWSSADGALNVCVDATRGAATWDRIDASSLSTSAIEPYNQSVNGRAITIPSGGDATLHTTSAAEPTLITPRLVNQDGSDRGITLNWGGTAAEDQLEFQVPSLDPLEFSRGYFLGNGLDLTATGDAAAVADSLKSYGVVERFSKAQPLSESVNGRPITGAGGTIHTVPAGATHKIHLAFVTPAGISANLEIGGSNVITFILSAGEMVEVREFVATDGADINFSGSGPGAADLKVIGAVYPQ